MLHVHVDEERKGGQLKGVDLDGMNKVKSLPAFSGEAE